MFVNKDSDFLALGFLTGDDVICTLGLLSVTPSGVDSRDSQITVLMCICHQHQSKKPSARKSLCLFTNILDVKHKT